MTAYKKNFRVFVQLAGLASVFCFMVLLVKIEAAGSDIDDLSWNDEFVLTETIGNCEKWQAQILREHELNKDENVRARDAFVLSELWKKDMLKNEIKDYLVEKYYKLALIQSYGNYNVPNWQVQCQQSFPFPSTWASFTPTLYKNGEVAWSTNRPQKEHAMCVNSSIITSQTGGKYENGDEIYYTIKIEQKKEDDVVWSRTVTTNKVVLKGLRDGQNAQVTKSYDDDSAR